MNSILSFVKREAVLCISLLLALVSCFFVMPDGEYISYIDFRTLALLFCLMAVMSGFTKAGLFSSLAERLIKATCTSRGLQAVLTLLCFVFSAFITNDVALITFVPFSITVLTLAKRTDMIPLTVVMQTVAANMGSCLTPIGNPQNIYLYNISDISFLEFFLLLVPYAGITLLALLVLLFFKKNSKVSSDTDSSSAMKVKPTVIYSVLFALNILGVMKAIPYPVCLAVTLIVLLLFDRKILLKVDYSLLLTFVGFFIFIGNIGRIPLFKEFIENMLAGREVIFSALISQIISNVPAALLLSHFTEGYSALLVGVNIGGLGTLIASMASLISYKYIAAALPDKKCAYLVLFSAVNFVLLGVLLGLNMLLVGFI